MIFKGVKEGNTKEEIIPGRSTQNGPPKPFTDGSGLESFW